MPSKGAGDTLQFVRYARLVKERGGVVVLAAPERLHPILRTARGIDRLVPLPREAPPPEFDVHCPLLSLPAVFGTTPETVPAQVPYLHAEPARIARWRKALEPVKGFRVGIAWQGSPTMLPYDRWRSVPLDRFAPLARVEGVRLVSLQYGPGSEQLEAVAGRFPIVDLAGQLDESAGAFLDTAAVMANLDLVVTCDTALAHLGGALGVPTWLVLAAVPNWRWLLDREDTPWYPTVRLFRQIRAGSWEEPFRRMAETLADLVGGDRADRRRDHARRVARPPRHPRDQGRSDHRPGEAAQRPCGAGEPRRRVPAPARTCHGPRGIDRGAAHGQRGDLGRPRTRSAAARPRRLRPALHRAGAVGLPEQRRPRRTQAADQPTSGMRAARGEAILDRMSL